MSDQRVIINGELVEPMEDSDPDLARAFQDFREALEADEGSTGWMKVYRIPVDMYGNPVSRGKNRSELFNFPWGTMQPDDVVDRVRQKFMRRGESRITIQITGGKTGERGIKLNRFITIERENEPEVKEKDSISEIMQMLQESQRAADERAEKMIFALTQRSQTAATDPMESMLKMMTVVGSFMGMMANGARGPVPGALPPADPFDQLTKMMGAMKSVKDFASSETPALSGPGDSDSAGSMLQSVAVIAKSLAPMFAQKASMPAGAAAPVAPVSRASRKAMGRAAHPGSPNVLAEAVKPMQPMKVSGIEVENINVPSNSPGVDSVSGSENNNDKENDVDMKTVKENLTIILSMYEAGQSPESVAKLVVDAVPEEGHDELVDMVSDDDFVEKMGIYDPRVIADAKSRDWFESLADETLTLLAE